MTQRKDRLDRDDEPAPEPERMITPLEEAGMDLASLDDPPQAEGPRHLMEEDASPEPQGNRRHDRLDRDRNR